MCLGWKGIGEGRGWFFVGEGGRADVASWRDGGVGAAAVEAGGCECFVLLDPRRAEGRGEMGRLQ